MKTHTFKKVNPFLSFLLTNVTLGVYVPYWFLSRKDSIHRLGDSNVKFPLLKILFFCYLFLAIYYVIGAAVFTEMGRSFIETINLWITFTGLGITYYSVFRLAEEIEREFPDVHFKRMLLVLFHIWYIQFKLNQLPKEDGTYENEKSIKGRKRLSFN
ncbi:hypothetical protein ACFOZY_10395 [Chungangia koreensis]|uniref:DUF4234 domain-containing protein n=1 Tax=Chungangia koreensis TaxID=752657 RepID=A0ABV8X6R2_9LACT